MTCRVLKLCRQQYYRWIDRPVTDAELDEAWLANAIGSLTPIEYEMINTPTATLAAYPTCHLPARQSHLLLQPQLVAITLKAVPRGSLATPRVA